MPSVSFTGLRPGLNNYYYYDNAVIQIKTGSGENILIKSDGDDYQEKRSWTDNKDRKCRSILKPGTGYKEWENNRLITNEKYSPETLRSRTGVSKYKKEVLGVSVIHLQKRYNRGSFAWEEVYWANGKLMYRYRKAQKKGEFFRPDGSLWGRYEGELNWAHRGRNCVAFDWQTRDIKRLYLIGPDLWTSNPCSFTWFDKKGMVRWQGQYNASQKTGVWIENYIECVYIRGVSVPKTLADAKPEEIDVYRVITEKNAQLRAVLIEKIGMNRIINELKGEILDEDTVNDFSLINIRLAKEDDKRFNGDKTINFLKVKCPSTQAFYTLRVPPGIKDVRTARQWTFGVEVDSEFKLREEALEFIKET